MKTSMRPDKCQSFTYFKLLFPSGIAAPDSSYSWGSGTFLHISPQVTSTSQIPALAVLKTALKFECSYLVGLCPSILGPCPLQKKPLPFSEFTEKVGESPPLAHQLALMNWHTILSFVINPSQTEVQG